LTFTGTLAGAAYYGAAGAIAAHDLDDRLVYNTRTGALYYDPAGTKADGLPAVQFATLVTRPAGVTNADFVVV
jgi:hypothetical protein